MEQTYGTVSSRRKLLPYYFLCWYYTAVLQENVSKIAWKLTVGVYQNVL